ncbi:hypothetical protein [Oleiphilus messinensis]|nr:hypothetical protein [Oleiphilus messinensis]
MKHLLLILVIIFISGCAYRAVDIPKVQPTEISGQDVYIMNKPDNENSPNWYTSSQLATDLQKAGYIPSIISQENLVPHGAMVITDIEPTGRCFSEPLLYVLSLGIIPHVGCAEFGHRFTMSINGVNQEKEVNAGFEVKTIYGWFAFLMLFSSNYSYGIVADNLREDSVEYNLLRQEINRAWK